MAVLPNNIQVHGVINGTPASFPPIGKRVQFGHGNWRRTGFKYSCPRLKASTEVLLVASSHGRRLRQNNFQANVALRYFSGGRIDRHGQTALRLLSMSSSCASRVRMVTILMGGNDTGSHKKGDYFRCHVREMIRAAEQHFPNARIAFLGLLPRPDTTADFAANDRIIHDVCREEASRGLIVDYVFLRDRIFEVDVGRDGVHLNDSGTKKLTRILWDLWKEFAPTPLPREESESSAESAAEIRVWEEATEEEDDPEPRKVLFCGGDEGGDEGVEADSGGPGPRGLASSPRAVRRPRPFIPPPLSQLRPESSETSEASEEEGQPQRRRVRGRGRQRTPPSPPSPGLGSFAPSSPQAPRYVGKEPFFVFSSNRETATPAEPAPGQKKKGGNNTLNEPFPVAGYDSDLPIDISSDSDVPHEYIEVERPPQRKRHKSDGPSGINNRPGPSHAPDLLVPVPETVAEIWPPAELSTLPREFREEPRGQLQPGNQSPIEALGIINYANDSDWIRRVAARRFCRVQANSGGGNCLYESMQQGLNVHGIHVTVQQLRRMVADQLQMYPDAYRHAFIAPDAAEMQLNEVIARDFEHFILYTRELREFGNAATLMAMADLFPMLRIVLYNSATKQRAMRFNRDAELEIVIVLHAAAEHYEAMLPIYQQQPDPADDSIVDINVRIAAFVRPWTMLPDIAFEGPCTDRVCPVHGARQAPQLRLPPASKKNQAGNPFTNEESRQDHQFPSAFKLPTVSAPTAFDLFRIRRPGRNTEFDEYGLPIFNGALYEPPRNVGGETIQFDVSNYSFAGLGGAREFYDGESQVQLANVIDKSPVCENCEMASTRVHDIGVAEYNGPRRNRYCGKLRLTKKKKVLLCKFCKSFLTGKEGFEYQGSCAIRDVLVGHNVHLSRSVWDELPQTIRDLWNASFAGRFPNARDPVFYDFSASIADWERVLKANTDVALNYGINKYFYPSARCPLGCFMWVDEFCFEGFNHYLEYKHKITVCRSDGAILQGIRPDYPTIVYSRVMKHYTYPGLAFHPEKGFVLLFCDKHANKQSRKQYVHTPMHPIYKDSHRLDPDDLAVVHAVPFITRVPKNRQHQAKTFSSVGVGGCGGFSTFSLEAHPSCRLLDNYMRHDIYAAELLTLTNREDIRKAFINRGSLESENYGIVGLNHKKEWGERECDINVSEEDVERCLQGSTFVDVNDIHFMEQIVRGRKVRAEEDRDQSHDQSRTTDPAKYFLKIIHPYGRHGHRPFIRNTLKKYGSLTQCIVNITLHCRPINKALIKRFVETGNDLIEDILQASMIIANQHSMNKKRKQVTPNQFEAKFNGLVVAENLEAETDQGKISKIMQSLCPAAVTALPYYDDVFREDIFKGEIVVIYWPNERSARLANDDVPTTVGKYSLLMVHSGHAKKAVNYDFRWDYHNGFWRVGGNLEQAIEHGKYNVPKNWRLLVFAKQQNKERLRQELERGLGVQVKVFCGSHETPEPLLKDTRETKKVCVNAGCTRKKVRWSCIYGLCQGPGFECSVGLCEAHYQAAVNSKAERVILRERGGEGNVEEPVLEGGTNDLDSEGGNNDLNRPSGDDEIEDDFDFPDDPLLLTSAENVNEALVTEADEDYRDQEEDINLMLENWADTNLNAVEIQDHLPPMHAKQDVLEMPNVSHNRQSIHGHLFFHHQLRNVVKLRQGIPTIAYNRWLWHLATRGGFVDPLLYPFAAFFPCTYYGVNDAGSVYGAPPSIMFGNWGMWNTRDPPGVASMDDHLSLQVRDLSLHSAHNIPLQHVLFDVKVNRDIARYSPTALCRKGLELKYSHAPSIEGAFNDSDILPTVKGRELATMTRKDPFTYFLTITPNIRGCPGMRQLAWLIEEYCEEEGFDFATIYSAWLPLFERQWNRVMSLYMNFLQTNSNGPVGPVKHMFYRYEYQDQTVAPSAGGMSHVHAGIALHPEPKEVSLARICGDSTQMFDTSFGTDEETLIDEKFFDNAMQYDLWQEFCKRQLTHDCAVGKYRCHKRWNKLRTAKVCSFPYHPPSLVASFEEMDLVFDEETIDLMKDLNFIWTSKQDHQQLICDPRLQPGRYHYPCRKGEKFTPTIPRIMAFFRSSVNVLCCDIRFSIAYLIKYIIGAEEHAIADIKSDGQKTTIDIAGQQGLKINNLKHKYRLLRSKVQSSDNVLHMALSEMICYLLDIEYTHCTAHFEHVNTNPAECRSTTTKSYSQRQVRSDGALGDEPCVRIRNAADIRPWRKYTAEQSTVINDATDSMLQADQVTKFSLRCPELRVFCRMREFFSWFTSRYVSVPNQRLVVAEQLSQQPWIDALGKHYRLRLSAVLPACDFINQRLNHERWSVEATALHEAVFLSLRELYMRLCTEDNRLPDIKRMNDWNKDDVLFFKRFVDVTADKEAFAVFSDVNPKNREKFYYHLCLTLGEFDTEYGLFNVPDFKQAFVRCGLVPSAECSAENVKRIMYQYCNEEALSLPITQRVQASYMKTANIAITDLLLNDGEYSVGVPPVLEASIAKAVDEKIQRHENERRENIIRSAYDDVSRFINDLPALADFVTATLQQPMQFNPRLPRAPHQSDASHAEQSRALDFCMQQVDKFLLPTTTHVRFPLIHGPAGSGKTFLFKLLILYCASKGLIFSLMAITSERARTLGSEHIHLQLPLDTSPSAKNHAQQMVSNCCKKLANDPHRLILLERASVIFFEEVGFLSAENYYVIDSVMRRIMDSNLPMGGKLVIANGDSRQISPVDGSPFWLSTHLITNFRIIDLKHFVRAAADDVLQECLRIFDKTEITTLEAENFADAIINNATHYASFDDVPEGAIRILPRRTAVNEAIRKALRQKRADPNINVIDFQSRDEVDTGAGSWKETKDRSVVDKLNRELYEEECLAVYLGAVVRLTYNENVARQKFSQGQAAFVTAVDCAANTITVKLIPPGVTDYIKMLPDWPEVVLRPRYSQSVVVGTRLLKGRRKQFPICHLIACTIHRMQGRTLLLVVTRLSLDDGDYMVWANDMLLVLISRTERLKDLGFVGDPAETRRALIHAVMMRSPNKKHVDERLRAMDILSEHPLRVITNTYHPYCPRQIMLPDTDGGFVYLVVSGKDPRITYIGQTNNLVRRLREHNNGYGSSFTNNVNLMPWLLLAFISGFPDVGNDTEMKEAREEVENYWQFIKNHTDTAMQVVHKGRQAVTHYNGQHEAKEHLQLTECGEVRSILVPDS